MTLRQANTHLDFFSPELHTQIARPKCLNTHARGRDFKMTNTQVEIVLNIWILVVHIIWFLQRVGLHSGDQSFHLSKCLNSS